MDLVDLPALRAAAERVVATCVRTPVLPMVASPTGSLWVKAESLQPTGAFKLRGATNALAAARARGVDLGRGVVTHSSGNHGQAVAFAAAAVGAPVTVVMPRGAVEAKVEATRALGAEVVMVDVAERLSTARELADRTGALLVPPYEDLDVIAGQGTVGLELVEDVAGLTTVLVPVGGGGLVSGVAAAVKLLAPDVRVVGVEPELAGDLAAGFAAGERRTWDAADTGRTVADGLRAASVGALNFAHVRAYVDDVVTVSKDAIGAAMRELATRARLVVEPSGAVATAAYLEAGEDLRAGTVVAVVSGGNVDPELLARVLTAA